MKLLVLLAALIQATTAEPLVGRWDAESRSRGGLSSWLTLSADHTCSQSSGAMVDGSWQLTGDRLTRTVPEGPGGTVHTEEFTIAVSDRMLTMQIGQDKRQLVRVGEPPTRGPSLVGVWSYPHPAGGTAYEDFEPDGRYLFRLPMVTTPCTWTADKTHLRLIAGQQPQSFQWSVDGMRMTLERDGARDVFRRETVTLPPARR